MTQPATTPDPQVRPRSSPPNSGSGRRSRDAHRVVVIGGGFGGLFATQALKAAPVEVTLIDRTGSHLFQPLLYQVATGVLSQGEIARPLREILRGQSNARVLLGHVNDIDLRRREITSVALGGTTVTPYDSLIVSAGATHSYFGNEGFAEYAPGLKSIDDALEVRARIFEAFELAESTPDHAERCRHLTFAIIGGGPTGVEVAGQIAELASLSLRRNYRSIDPADSRVVILEAGPQLLATFGEGLSERTRRDLERLGIEVLTGARVVDVDPTGIRYTRDGREKLLPATTKVWAAGVAVSPLGGILASASGVASTRSGQLEVGPDCTLPGHPEVFVVGDMMSVPGVASVAQVAIQSGEFAARVIKDRLGGRRPPASFRYRDRGSLATIARLSAVARLGRVRFAGAPAWFLWLGVHLVTLNGYRNRVSVTLHWAVTFILNMRAERAATPAQARHGLGSGVNPGTMTASRPAVAKRVPAS